MTLSHIVICGIFLFLFLSLLPKRRALEKRARGEERQLKRGGFRRIAGEYYILGDGTTGIYTRKEAREVTTNRVNPRIEP